MTESIEVQVGVEKKGKETEEKQEKESSENKCRGRDDN